MKIFLSLLLIFAATPALQAQQNYPYYKWIQSIDYGAICYQVVCNQQYENSNYFEPRNCQKIVEDSFCEQDKKLGFKYTWILDQFGGASCKKITQEGYLYESVNSSYCQHLPLPRQKPKEEIKKEIEMLPEESLKLIPVPKPKTPVPLPPKPLPPQVPNPILPTPSPGQGSVVVTPLDPIISPRPVEPTPVVIQDEFTKTIAEYKVIIYINKSTHPSVGQRIVVFEKGNTKPILMSKVSTGTEEIKDPPLDKKTGQDPKPYKATTPIGYFNPVHLTPLHKSKLWQVDMPNAVFFYHGIALHAAAPTKEPLLGQRDSGGCIRLSFSDSQMIFDLINKYPPDVKNKVPLLGRYGEIRKDKNGKIIRDVRHQTLIVVDDEESAQPKKLMKLQQAFL